MRNDVNCRVAALRLWMRGKGIDAFIFPSTDPHNGEYVPDHWKGREWISGFDGSAGTAVVTAEKAALWTDSRYFIAAGEQLRGTPFVLMRERIAGTPSVAQWLAEVLGEGSHCVGLDGMVFSADSVEGLCQELRLLGDFALGQTPIPLRQSGSTGLPFRSTPLWCIQWNMRVRLLPRNWLVCVRRSMPFMPIRYLSRLLMISPGRSTFVERMYTAIRCSWPICLSHRMMLCCLLMPKK